MNRKIIKQRFTHSSHSEQGFILLAIVFGLIVFSALIAGMLYLSSSTSLQVASSNQSLNAWNLAEAGYRYLATNYLNTRDTNDDGDADEEKSAFLELIDGKQFTITDRGTINLNVWPYYFSNRTGTTASATTFSVQLPGGTPPNFTMPANGKIQIGDDASSVPPRDYTNGSFDAGSGNFSFRLSSAMTIKHGESVYMVLYPNSVQNNIVPGNNFTLALNTYTIQNFPRRNGNIQIGSETRLYRYTTATASGSVLTLTNLRHSDGSNFNISVTTATAVIFKKFLVLKSRGQVGSEQRTLTFYQPLTDSRRQSPPEIITLNTASSLNSNFTESTSITGYQVSSVQFAGGGSGAISNITALSTTTRGGSLNDYKCGAFWYSNTSKINTNWTPDKILNYDVQVKLSSGNNLREMTHGLAIRARNTSGTGTPNTYLALTFMLYNLPTLYVNHVHTTNDPPIIPGDTITGETSGARGTVQGSPEITEGSWSKGNTEAKLRLVNVTGTFRDKEFLQVNGDRRAKTIASGAYVPAVNDYIPNEIKPTFDDFTPQQNTIGPLLLVLWERRSDNTFRWLAYKDVTQDIYVRGLQDWPSPYGSCTSSCNQYDGQVIDDNVSLLLRVEEKREVLASVGTSVKYNDINVFYGDDSARYASGRTANSFAYDIMSNRLRYMIGSSTAFPTWPPKELSNWGPAVDYFSHIENPDTRPQFQWDAINPSITDITVLQILNDGTLRLTELATPESGSYTQAEIGMISCGNITTSGAFAVTSFADFSLKIGNSGNDYGGFSGTSMAWE